MVKWNILRLTLLDLSFCHWADLQGDSFAAVVAGCSVCVLTSPYAKIAHCARASFALKNANFIILLSSCNSVTFLHKLSFVFPTSKKAHIHNWACREAEHIERYSKQGSVKHFSQ